MRNSSEIRTVKLVLPPKIYGLIGETAQKNRASKRTVIEEAVSDFLGIHDIGSIPVGSLSAQPLSGVTYRAPISSNFYKDLYSKTLFAGQHLDSVVYTALLQKFNCYTRI